MSDNPQTKIKAAGEDKPERCSKCKYFAKTRSSGNVLRLFEMGTCIYWHVEVLPDSTCRVYRDE